MTDIATSQDSPVPMPGAAQAPEPAARAPVPIARRLGELLVEAGLVDEAQLTRALAESRQSGEPLGKVLLKHEWVNEEQLGLILSAQAGVDYMRVGGRVPAADALKLLSPQFMATHKVLPLAIERQELVVAMVRPNDVATLDEIRLLTGLKPRPHVTTTRELEEALLVLAGDSRGSVAAALAAVRETNHTDGAARRQVLDEQIALEDQPVVKLLNSVLADAVGRGASDVHLESREKRLQVRFRIDGLAVDAMDLPKDLEPAVVARIKIMANLDIAESRAPQDGRAHIEVGGRGYDLRINTMPTIWGETAVIRILRRAMLFGGLDALGIHPDVERPIRQMITAPYGIVLATGPTGCGKTTTLYSALYELNTPERTIFTVEDPVEYPLEGVSQSQVNPRVGLTFASALRAMLRQDPDVVLVGEVRDAETAGAAVYAALTGHLVLSTLHTNDAPTTPTRLLEMGLAPYLLTSSLAGVIAQRLVRRLCMHCKAPLAAAERAALPAPLDAMAVHRSVGCARCNGTGYAGRVGLFEAMPITLPIQELILERAPAYRLREAALREGMTTLADDALRKIRDGTTDPREAARVLGPRWMEDLCRPSASAP